MPLRIGVAGRQQENLLKRLVRALERTMRRRSFRAQNAPVNAWLQRDIGYDGARDSRDEVWRVIDRHTRPHGF